jgi:hypothetical protein
MNAESQSGVTVTGIYHDLKLNRSTVHVVWDDGSERRLGLVIPFGCTLDDAKAEAEKAIKTLATELATIPVNTAK